MDSLAGSAGSIAGGFLGAAGNVISTSLTNSTNRQMNESNNKLQQQLAAQANQWNIDQWNRENLYNLPSAQMQRLRDAGLNPSLAMTSGDLMNEAAASPQANMANTNASRNIAPTLDPLMMAQIRNLDAQTDSVQHDTERKDELQPYTIQQMKVDIDNALARYDNIKSDTAVKDSQVFLNTALGAKARQDASNLLQDYRFNADSYKDRLRVIKFTADKYGLESDKLSAELERLPDMLDQQLQVIRETVSLYRAQTQHEEAGAQLARASIGFHQTELNQSEQQILYNYELGLQNLEVRMAEVNGQLERWDDMTTNERIELAASIFKDVAGLAMDVFTKGGYSIGKGAVTETFQKTSGGGRPTKTVHTVTRRRRSKDGN